MSDNSVNLQSKEVALVLSSGGPRGFAYIGAIEELERRGYKIVSVTGCSIGSLVGGVYAAGGLQDFKQWLFELDNFKMMSLLDVSLSKSYLVKGEKVIEAIKSIVPDVAIESLDIPYTAVATDLYTGEEVVFRSGRLFDAIRASISIPSLFRPVKMGRRVLVDGGIVNTTPLSLAPRNGHDILVAFDVNDVDKEAITEYLDAVEETEASDEAAKREGVAILEEIASSGKLSFIDKVRMAGDRAREIYDLVKDTRIKNRELDKMAEDDNLTFIGEDNYYSIITRSFSLMNHTISEQSLKLYRPDILVKMSLDSYGAISDYVKGEEISEIGRQLMSDALDKYEAKSNA